jgi:hypothetical protein
MFRNLTFFTKIASHEQWFVFEINLAKADKIIKSERIHLISISEKYNESLENKVISINAK